MKKSSISLAAAIIVLAAGGLYFMSSSNVEENNLISYDLGELPVEVTENILPFDYTADTFKTLQTECGVEVSDENLASLADTFASSQKHVYTFNYTEPSQGGDFLVTVLPNQAEYETLEAFKADFDICAVGGEAYPLMLNENWLVFTNACGSGYDDESGNPHGCEIVKDAVMNSLSLN